MSADDEESVDAALTTWAERLSERDGVPGGGEACGVMIAIAASLLAMVARYAEDSGSLPDDLDRLRMRALAAAEEDGRRSRDFGAAFDGDGDDDRSDAIAEATSRALASSAAIGTRGIEVVVLLPSVAAIAPRSVHADLVVASEALAAGLNGIAATIDADRRVLGRHGASNASDAALASLVERFATSAGRAERVARPVADR